MLTINELIFELTMKWYIRADKKYSLGSATTEFCWASKIKQIKYLRYSSSTILYSTSIGKIKKNVEMPGIEPGAFHMQSERSTTELHPLLH